MRLICFVVSFLVGSHEGLSAQKSSIPSKFPKPGVLVFEPSAKDDLRRVSLLKAVQLLEAEDLVGKKVLRHLKSPIAAQIVDEDPAFKAQKGQAYGLKDGRVVTLPFWIVSGRETFAKLIERNMASRPDARVNRLSQNCVQLEYPATTGAVEEIEVDKVKHRFQRGTAAWTTTAVFEPGKRGSATMAVCSQELWMPRDFTRAAANGKDWYLSYDARNIASPERLKLIQAVGTTIAPALQQRDTETDDAYRARRVLAEGKLQAVQAVINDLESIEAETRTEDDLTFRAGVSLTVRPRSPLARMLAELRPNAPRLEPDDKSILVFRVNLNVPRQFQAPLAAGLSTADETVLPSPWNEVLSKVASDGSVKMAGGLSRRPTGLAAWWLAGGVPGGVEQLPGLSESRARPVELRMERHNFKTYVRQWAFDGRAIVAGSDDPSQIPEAEPAECQLDAGRSGRRVIAHLRVNLSDLTGRDAEAGISKFWSDALAAYDDYRFLQTVSSIASGRSQMKSLFLERYGPKQERVLSKLTPAKDIPADDWSGEILITTAGRGLRADMRLGKRLNAYRLIRPLVSQAWRTDTR